MIELKSCISGGAKRLSANLKPDAGMSSPWGEESGEGELSFGGRQSAPIVPPDFWILNSDSFPAKILQPFTGVYSLLQPFTGLPPTPGGGYLTLNVK